MTKKSFAYRWRKSGDPAVGLASEIIRASHLKDTAIAQLAGVGAPTVSAIRHQKTMWPRNSTITGILFACGAPRGTMIGERFHGDPLNARLRTMRAQLRRVGR